ncbi:MAG: flavodoxin family protein [Candidatus Bathyarchaeota archaeon]|nr:flavodoxin family protein [Candidatus Bathyarchaeota archaeon]
MKILGLVGSPRRGGNTDLLISAVLYGAGAGNNDIDKAYLYDADIMPCVDCRGCKKENFQCTLKDDMKQLYPKLEEADVIVFGTPLYWYGSTGKMKLFIDRLRPYVASGKLKGKKAVIVVPAEEGAEACNCLVQMFELSFKYLGMEFVGKILAKAGEKAEVKGHPEVLDEAFNLGKELK